MSASFYSPYESDNTEGYSDIFKQRLKETFSLGTAAYAFAINPSNFSITEGLRVPFSGFFRKDLWKGASEDFKNKKFGSLAGRTWQGITKPQRFGAALRSKSRSVSSSANAIINKKTRILNSNIYTRARELTDTLMEHASSGKNQRVGSLASRTSVRRAIRDSLKVGGLNTPEQATKLIGAAFGDPTGEVVQSLNSKIRTNLSASIVEAGKATNSEMSLISSIARKGGAAKFTARAITTGLVGGKITAIAMLATLVGSTAMSLGEPIGAAMISSVDKGLNLYNNRFAVEMGGGLARGYLSSGAATERQRAVQAISKAYINGRSAVGQEAFFLHQ
jgi:hypothetical protein